MDHLHLETLDAPASRIDHPLAHPTLGLTIAWHADTRRVGERVPITAPLAVNRIEPTFQTAQGAPTHPLVDPFISRRGLRITPQGTGALVELVGRGPLAVDAAPVSGAIELDAARLHAGVVLTLARRVVLVLGWIPPPRTGPDHGLVGESLALSHLRAEIERAALTSAPVLLRGSSGTGKELVARAIHAQSPRRAQPYVPVNTAAVSPSTAAAAFFGHTKGAFTGAGEARPGFFGAADGGSLFLDEIGDLPASLQPMLLRAIETGEIQPVGRARSSTVDVRLISATDQDLEAGVEAGRFRRPLLHRLAGYQIHLAPLAQRRDDIGRLLRHFLKAALEPLSATACLGTDTHAERPWLSARQVTPLICAPWSGNVRALRNAARRIALAGHDQPVVSAAGLAPEGPPAQPDHPTPPPSPRPDAPLTEARVLEALRASRWTVHAAARRLGVPRSTLYGFIDRTGVVPKAADLGADAIRAAVADHPGDLGGAANALRVSIRALRARVAALGLDDGG